MLKFQGITEKRLPSALRLGQAGFGFERIAHA
jgi:hypothetical protein